MNNAFAENSDEYPRSVFMPIFVFGLLLLLGLGCGLGDVEDLKPIPSEYHGNWQGDDSSALTIRSNGTADYKLKETEVTDATVDYYDEEKEIELVSSIIADKSFTIDEPPQDGRMKLSGISYRKVEKFETRTTADLPTDEEAVQLAKESMDELVQAGKKNDFTDFYNYISDLWRQQTSAQKIKEMFSETTFVKGDLSSILSRTPKITEGPTLEPNDNFKIAVIEGEYYSEPVLVFTFKYILEGKEWKLVRLDTDFKK